MNISIIVFIVLVLAAVGLFAKNLRTISRNIKLGKKLDRSDRKSERFRVGCPAARQRVLWKEDDRWIWEGEPIDSHDPWQ